MAKPVLFLDTNFIIHVFGQEPDNAPKGANYDPAMGKAILDELSAKYDLRTTSTVIGEATFSPKYSAIGDWFKDNEGSRVKIYDTSQFTGKNAGEMSIVDLITRTQGRDPTLPPATDTANLQIASIDKYFGKKSPLGPNVRPTQAVVEESLADGTLSRANYDRLEVKSGDMLRNRGGFLSAEDVLAGQRTPLPAAAQPAPQKPPVQQKQPAPKPDAPEPPKAPPPEAEPVAVQQQTSKFAGPVENHAEPQPAPKPVTPETETPPPAAPVTAPPSASTAAAVMAGTNKAVVSGFTAVGAVQGTIGAVEAAKRGDTAGVVVNGSNAAVATTNLGITVAKTAGVEVAPVLESTIGKLNVPLTVATGVYQVATEKGNFIDTEKDGSHTLGHKGERATAVLATTGTGLGLAAAGVSTGGVVVAVAAVAYTGEKVIENRRAWNDLDHQIEENGAPRRRDVHLHDDDGKPDIRRYWHIFPEMVELSRDIKVENLSQPLPRGADGRIAFDDLRKIDMRDPKNIAEIERVLDQNIAREGKIMADNDSVLPKWLRFSDSVSTYTTAEMYQADMKGARQELEMYKKEMRDWDAAHPDNPVTTGAAPQRPAGQAPKPKGHAPG